MHLICGYLLGMEFEMTNPAPPPIMVSKGASAASDPPICIPIPLLRAPSVHCRIATSRGLQPAFTLECTVSQCIHAVSDVQKLIHCGLCCPFQGRSMRGALNSSRERARPKTRPKERRKRDDGTRNCSPIVTAEITGERECVWVRACN